MDNNVTIENIGEVIAMWRTQRNLSQNKLAKLAGISRMSIVRYENNERSPDLNTLSKIANALDLSLNAFILPSTYDNIDETIMSALERIDPKSAELIKADMKTEEYVRRLNRIDFELNETGQTLWIEIGELLCNNPLFKKGDRRGEQN